MSLESIDLVSKLLRSNPKERIGVDVKYYRYKKGILRYKKSFIFHKYILVRYV